MLYSDTLDLGQLKTGSLRWNDSFQLIHSGFPASSTKGQIKLDSGDLPAGHSDSLFRTISKTNQGMSRESACDQRGYHGINQLIQGGGAINTARSKYKPSKWQRKGLNLTCNLTGQTVSEEERGRATEGLRTERQRG